MTPYNKELERTTILSRAQRYADSAEVTIKQTDMDYFIVSITLLYESQSDVPGMEDQDEVFGAITSTGLVEAVIHYGEEEQETVFDNRDIELSEMTYGDDGYHLYLSLTKEDFAEVSRKMANEEVNILLDGEVVAGETLPVDKTGKKVETNYMKFKIDSYDMVLKLRALSETIPLKYEVERVNWE